MKIQVFSPFFPHPRNEGAFITISEQTRRFRELGYSISLIYWKGPDPKPEVLQTEFEGVEVRRLGAPRGEEKSTFRILKSLLSPWSSAELFHYPPHLLPELNRLPSADLRIFNYSFAGPWLSRKRLSGKTAVVFHNIEGDLYAQRTLSAPQGPARWIHGINATKIQKHERDIAGYVDELWFNSPKDLEDYGRSGEQKPLRAFVPFFSDAFLREKRALRKAPPSDAAKPTIGFVGGLHFRPNQVSAEWILDRLAPELQKRGFSGRLWIIGKNPPERLLAKAKAYPFAEVLGFLPNLDSYWSEVSLSLSPHIEGSGVRMKLLESLAVGVPVLTHRMALDQLTGKLRDHPQIYALESPADWAEIIMKSPRTQPTAESDRALTSPPDWISSLERSCKSEKNKNNAT